MRIKGPGFYELSDEDYFADPCPKPSLTQSLARTLLRRSPLHMWYEHPRLNPDATHEHEDKFDLGLAAHRLAFGKGRKLAIGDFADFRTKAARDWRDGMLAQGELPILQRTYDRADAMAKRLRDEFEIMGETNKREITAIAESKGVWLRTKIDWLSSDARIALDYKTTSHVIERTKIQDHAFGMGWHLQGAMHEKILDYLHPELMGKRLHLFVLQETYAPYAVYKCQLGESAIDIGRQQIAEAIALFKRCLDADNWPGPSSGVLHLAAPAWGTRSFEEEQYAKVSALPSEA